MKNHGFTMVELLISVAIFSFIITGLTIALMQQQRQFNLTREASDVDQTARAALDFIATEIRNSVSRQGKTFSLRFMNGGSGVSPPCSDNTTSPGSTSSPPDCLTIYTWDITKGQYVYVDPITGKRKRIFPSIAEGVEVVSTGPPLVLQLPKEWFKKPDGTPLSPPLVQAGDLLGFRSRLNLCSPDDSVNCVETPARCTECAVILRVSSVDTTTMRATIDNDVNLIKEHNFPVDSFSSMSDFINGVNVNGIDYGFVSSISSQVSEMTVVQTKTFRIDRVNRELEMSQNGSSFQPIAGGADAPGIVDLQFVFNLQDSDGGITKIGVPLDAINRRFPDFQSEPSLLGREKDIRTVEIYLIVRSRIKPQLIRGQSVPIQTIPQVGDVLERQTSHSSLGEGFMYRVFSTTVYVRNMAREEFG
jgi:prepilin-type N-terminal cleavage/methylation domain-containing protein